MNEETNQQTHEDKCRLTRKAIHLSMVMLNGTLKELLGKLQTTADCIGKNSSRMWDGAMVVTNPEKQPKTKRSALETIQWRAKDTADDCNHLLELSEGILALRILRKELLCIAETKNEDIMHHLSYLFGFLPWECRNTKQETAREQISKILNILARYALNQKETNLHFEGSQPLYCYDLNGDAISAIQWLNTENN